MKIVIDNNYGLCNKLWSVLNPVLWSIKNKKRSLFFSYDINYKYFPELLLNRYLWFPLIYTGHYLGYRIATRIHHKLKKIKKQNRFASSSIWYGWADIHNEISDEDIKIIRRIFKPSKRITLKIKKRFREEKSNHEIIIGVHIRRGDYATHENGRYYYSIFEYKDIMKILREKFKSKEVKFFIASNEIINPDDFSELNIFYFGESAIVDLYSLAECDYIIGPPSTFSMWASLYGGKLQSFIMHKGQKHFNFHPLNKNISLEELETIYG